MSDDLMGRNEYARHRGCAPNAVRKAENDGRIAAAVKRDDKGVFIGIDWRLADKLWQQNTDPVEAARSAGTSAGPEPASDLIASSDAGTVADSQPSANSASAQDKKDPHGYFEARAERERFQAKQAELDYLEAIGELISKRDQRQVNQRRYRATRDKLRNIPDRTAAELAAERDPARVHARLLKEIDQVLHELSDDSRAEVARGSAERVAA